MNPAQLLVQAEGELPWIEQHLRSLVLQESPTEDKEAVDRAGTLVSTLSDTLGGTTKCHKQNDFGDILDLSFGSKPARILVLGHLDTVWPINTLQTMPWKVENGCFWGPGVLDMKAGIVMLLAAVKILKKGGLEPSIRLLLNSEEEVGSPVSRPITEDLARSAEAVFVLEPAQGLAYKTSRKGVGHYRIDVKGVGSHSGVDFEKGHSAIRELARLVETISDLTDPGQNRTVNCGVIGGGTRSNVVAEHAFCEVDVRITTPSDAAHIDTLLRSLAPTDPACSLTITGGINRPPMERSPGIVCLFRHAQSLASQLGFTLEESTTGGGSDGNFASALGIPTLDGMGAVGGGAHASNEHVEIGHLAVRTALMASMIASLG